MSVVALKPYAADSSDPGLSGYTEFMKARMPNADPANFAAEYANMVAEALIVVLQPCKDDLSRENIMAQAANLKGVALLVLLPGITLHLGHRPPPDEGYMVEFRDG